MQDLITTEATMTSREIAELTGKRHDNVMRDTRAMLIELHGEGGLLRFEDTLPNGQNGQSYPIYRLPKRETLILISGYSVELRAKIIDRWAELEAAARDPMKLLNDPAALRGLLGNYAERVETLERQNAVLTVDSEALTQIAKADGSLSVTEAAKTLGIQPKELFVWMNGNGWIYQRAGAPGWIGYQSHISNGDLVHKTHSTFRPDGSEIIRTQVRVTPQGLTKLAKRLGSGLHPANLLS